MNNKLLLYVLLFPLVLQAQRIDNTVSYRDMNKGSYFRFNYDNDFFSALDFYYTQGYSFEIAATWLEKNPLNKIFITAGNSNNVYGLLFEQSGFTPTDITADEILYGDRPFAATIALKSFLSSTDTINKSRFTSSLTLGMIGPAAFGDEMQTGIHKWIDDDIPMGWQYQIKNDVIINYEFGYEKQLINLRNILAVTSQSKVRLGTLNTNLSTGFTATLGILNSAFSAQANKPFQVYLFAHPAGTLVGYDATMQGGLFNTKSPYTIPDSDVERVTLQNSYGIVIKHRSLYAEYFQSAITKEFATGGSHRWGGFKAGFTF